MSEKEYDFFRDAFTPKDFERFKKSKNVNRCGEIKLVLNFNTPTFIGEFPKYKTLKRRIKKNDRQRFRISC